MALLSKVKNIFSKKEPVQYSYNSYYSSSYRPGTSSPFFSGERSLINSIFSRIAADVSGFKINHVKVDYNTGRYEETLHSDLNDILTLRANKDQTAKELIMDICDKVFKYGYVACVPYEFRESDGSMIGMRTGLIKDWYPNSVKVDLYDDRDGEHREIILPKDEICIFVNPFYGAMNEPSSTLQRLLYKLSLLDAADDRAQSGKLDIIIQLPYVTKTDIQQKQAEKRQAAIENQLANSHYGIAYIDSTEHITQLNRPAENNLLTQIQYLTDQLYNQLGVTKAIFDGSATEEQIINYYKRTVEPYLNMIVDEMNVKLLTKTARTQGQLIRYFDNPFRLSSVNTIAEAANKLVSNEILTRNEIRAQLGYTPSSDAHADSLINPNINTQQNISNEGGKNQNGN